MERLQKVIAQSGYCSRRKAEELIAAGKVTVNGEKVTEMGVKVSNSDVIMVEGQSLEKEPKVYYMMYKPKNMICSVHDEHGRPCVIDLFPDVQERIYPIGRLDYDSTGLLLLTNDGEFANLLMHPSSHLEKVYDITIRGILDDETIQKLTRGIYLEGVKTLPCQIRIDHRDEEHNVTRLKIALVEGKNRQIRKMFEAVGFDVIRLHRESIGPVFLHGMIPGETRRLKPHEVKQLRALAMQKKSEGSFYQEKNPYRPKAKRNKTSD